jgi:6-phosphofructokinase
MSKRIGILTTGGDSPGINAVLRGVGKAAHSQYGMRVAGFQDGFLGLVERKMVDLEGSALSNILTLGGTILGTSRDRPDRMLVDGKIQDKTAAVLEACRSLELEGLVVLGGSDAQESALHLKRSGMNVITLPVTIDNDVACTDTSVGFDTALGVAAEAIDRLHTTASSHHRVIIVEVMGKTTGWLTLGAGTAGGADVILIPEIPYDQQSILKAITERSQAGKRFSIVAVSEGAVSKDTVQFFEQAQKVNARLRGGPDRERVAGRLGQIERQSAGGNTIHLASQLEKLTGMEARVTILGYLQRGGSPSAADRVLATQLGTACAAAANEGRYGFMLGVRSGLIVPAPLEEVAGQNKPVPADHPWIHGARMVGTNLGD